MGARIFAYGLALLAWGLACPGMAAADPLPAAVYGRLPLMDQPQLSPDGNKLAVLSPIKGRRCIRVQNLFGTVEDPHFICPGLSEVRWFAWKTNERLLAGIYTTTPNPNGYGPGLHVQTDLIAVDADGGHEVALVRPRQGVLVNFERDSLVDLLADDPDHMLASVYPSEYPYASVIKVDVRNGEKTTFQPDGDRTTQWLTDGNGHLRYALGLRGRQLELRYRLDDAAPFEPTPNSATLLGTAGEPQGLLPTVRLIASGSKPGQLYFGADSETGRMELYLWDLVQGRTIDRIAGPADADIDGLIVDRGGLVGYTYTDDRAHQVFLDPAWQHDQAAIAKALPGNDITILSRVADGQRVLVRADRGSLPGDVYLLVRTPGKPSALTRIGPVRSEIPDSAVAPVKPVTYVARDGLRIHAYLTLPPNAGAGPIPFVVLPHGGPVGRDFWHFDFLAQMIATRGYGVLQPNFRGSSGYGRPFKEAGFQQWGQRMQDDVTDGTRWLIAQGLADPRRICIVGWSYGGYAALMGAIREPGLYRCVASMAGPTDLRRGDPYVDRRNYVLKGDPESVDDRSPVLLADRITVPVLLAHGRQDTNVPVEETEHMQKALERAGKPVEAVYFDLDDHFLYYESYRIEFLTRLERFLKANLDGSDR